MITSNSIPCSLGAEVSKTKELGNDIETMEVQLSKAKADLCKCKERLTKTNKSGSKQLAQLAFSKSVTALRKERKMLEAKIKGLETMLSDKVSEKRDQDEIIEALETEIEMMKKREEADKILTSTDTDQVDWMKLSKRLGESASWQDCRKMWEHNMDRNVNQGHWSENEVKALLELVRCNPSGSWELISKELGVSALLSASSLICSFINSFIHSFSNSPTLSPFHSLITHSFNNTLIFFPWPL